MFFHRPLEAPPAQVVITDGPLPEVASAALRADGLSIIEAKDELQAQWLQWLQMWIWGFS